MVIVWIEADHVGFAHISTGVMDAMCRKNPFPSRWVRPFSRTKPVCQTCLDKYRKIRR